MLSFRKFLIEQSKPGRRFTTHGGRFTNPTPEQIRMMDSDPNAWYNQIDLRTAAEKAEVETDPILKRFYELDAATERFSQREKGLGVNSSKGGFTKDLTFDDRLTPFPEGFGDVPPTTAVNKGVAKAASVLDPIDFATRNLKPGPAMVAGVVGGLAGEHIVKPAAEKAGVFDAVGEVSKAAFERMPPAAVDAADKALGAAQYVLGGGPVDQLTTDAVKGVQSGMEGIMKDRAEQQKKTGRTNYSAPFGY